MPEQTVPHISGSVVTSSLSVASTQDKEKNQDLVSSQFSSLNKFRKGIRILLVGMVVFALVWVNIHPQYFPFLSYFNLYIGAGLIYLIVYATFISRLLKNTFFVYLGALSTYLVFYLLIYFSGGNESIFIGYLYLFVLAIGLSLGVIPLFLTALIVQTTLVGYAMFDVGQLETLTRNTILNMTSVAMGYFIMKEFINRGKEYAEIEALAKKESLLGKEKDDLISIVSHEFRTPISSVKGYVGLLQRDKSRLSPEQLDFLKKIDLNLAKLQSIMENTLNVSVIESGGMTLFYQPVDLEKLVTETLNSTLRIQAEEKGLSLVLNLPRTRLPLISADPQRLRQVIINLADNAIKYTEHGGVTCSLDKQGNWVLFSVADTGKGIDGEDLPRIFEKFYRAGDYKTRTAQGSGLGLYITRQLIEKHGGRIEISSETGKGTTFVVKLPIPGEDETWT